MNDEKLIAMQRDCWQWQAKRYDGLIVARKKKSIKKKMGRPIGAKNKSKAITIKDVVFYKEEIMGARRKKVVQKIISPSKPEVSKESILAAISKLENIHVPKPVEVVGLLPKEDKPFVRPPAKYDNNKSLYGIDYNDL